MLLDRTHKNWMAVSVAMVMIAAAAYAGYAWSAGHGVSGGSKPGLLFGIVGSAMMIFAALLAVRKRLPTWRVGSAQFWLRGHLWLGSVGFLFILFHSGFGWGGLLENLLWITFGWTVLTGFVGLALQQVIPRLLTTRVPLETMAVQIPFLSRTMLFRADQLIAKQVGALDVEFESLKPFAEAVLQQQRVLKRESDFPRELAKVYANVSRPEPEAQRPPTAEPAVVAAKPSPPAAAIASASTPGPAANDPASASESAAAKPLSKLEQIKAAQAAKQAAAQPALSSPAPASDAPPPPTVPAAPKPLSKLEQIKALQASKPAASAPPAASSPAANGPAPASEPAVAKPLSKLEQIKALQAAKGSPADKPADAAPPLTIEKSAAGAPPPVRKPPTVTKPGAEKPVAVASPKPNAPAPIPPAMLNELRGFHVKAVRPFLNDGRSLRAGLHDGSAARRQFTQLRSDLPSELHDAIQQLEDWCEERRQFNTQLRLHRWLHWWLILHIPPSIALLVLFVAHVVVSLRVVPFGR